MALRTTAEEHRHPHNAGDPRAFDAPGADIRIIRLGERGSSRAATGRDPTAAVAIDDRKDCSNCMLFEGWHAGCRNRAGPDEEPHSVGSEYHLWRYHSLSGRKHHFGARQWD